MGRVCVQNARLMSLSRESVRRGSYCIAFIVQFFPAFFFTLEQLQGRNFAVGELFDLKGELDGRVATSIDNPIQVLPMDSEGISKFPLIYSIVE